MSTPKQTPPRPPENPQPAPVSKRDRLEKLEDALREVVRIGNNANDATGASVAVIAEAALRS